jgi:hypothetical protein
VDFAIDQVDASRIPVGSEGVRVIGKDELKRSSGVVVHRKHKQ